MLKNLLDTSVTTQVYFKKTPRQVRILQHKKKCSRRIYKPPPPTTTKNRCKMQHNQIRASIYNVALKSFQASQSLTP